MVAVYGTGGRGVNKRWEGTEGSIVQSEGDLGYWEKDWMLRQRVACHVERTGRP